MYFGWKQEEDFHLENVYYSEMKDAGFFDADWEWCSNHHMEDGHAFQNLKSPGLYIEVNIFPIREVYILLDGEMPKVK